MIAQHQNERIYSIILERGMLWQIEIGETVENLFSKGLFFNININTYNKILSARM